MRRGLTPQAEKNLHEPCVVSCAGLIVQAQSGFFKVATASSTVTCRLRGRLKHDRARGDIAALGDRVQIQVLPDGSGVIEKVEARSRSIVRLDPRPRGAYQQVLLANADQAVFVFACAHPEPRLRMLDRFLVIAEKHRIPSIIVANKIDLVTKKRAQQLFSPYGPAGYPILFTSAHTGAGLQQFSEGLRGKITVLAGPSGAGKSSLLNAVSPGLDLRVQELGAVNKGQHTTVVRQLHLLDHAGTYVADTPGWKSLALWDTEPEEIDAYFPEIRPWVSQCRFSDCNHDAEPGCAVRLAVDDGAIHPERYESYLRLRTGQSLETK